MAERTFLRRNILLIPDVVISQVTDIREVAPGIFYIVCSAPGLGLKSAPGQFVMVRAHEYDDPLLCRPISLCGAAGDTVEILVQVKGKGTACMSAWRPGTQVTLLGPLGSGFTIHPDLKSALLVGGGIGVAPLLFLARSLQARIPECDIKLFMGARTVSDTALLEQCSPGPCDMYIATEDGTMGMRGLVTELLQSFLEKNAADLQPARCAVFGCGPNPMMQALAAVAAVYCIPCQLSLEAHMACGVGACLGCAVEAKDGAYRRVCAEGPVFDSRDIY